MKRIVVNDDIFVVCGTVLVEKVTTSMDALKEHYTLADTVLRNGNEYYVCNKVIEAEFKDLK